MPSLFSFNCFGLLLHRPRARYSKGCQIDTCYSLSSVHIFLTRTLFIGTYFTRSSVCQVPKRLTIELRLIVQTTFDSIVTFYLSHYCEYPPTRVLSDLPFIFSWRWSGPCCWMTCIYHSSHSCVIITTEKVFSHGWSNISKLSSIKCHIQLLWRFFYVDDMNVRNGPAYGCSFCYFQCFLMESSLQHG